MTSVFDQVARPGARSGTPAKGGVAILLYHRVTNLAFDPQMLSVTPRHFEQHLGVLRRHAEPLSLAALGDRLAEGTVPRRGVVVTFDDGYADNYREALPILERYDVPATVFAVSGYVGADREYWWDELEQLVFETPKLPSHPSLTIGEGVAELDLSDGSGARRADTPDWNVTDRADPTLRHALYRTLFDRLRPMPHECRDRVLDEIAERAGVARFVRPTHRPMTRDELRRLHDGGLVSIGAHTATHPVLSMLPAERQRREIVASKLALEETIDAPVTTFAYPFGTRHDYADKTVRTVDEVGFTVACANTPGLVGPDAPRYALPRLLIRDWDGDTLWRKLQEAGVLV